MSRNDYTILALVVLTIGCGGLTVRAFVRGSDVIQVVLLASLTVYALLVTFDNFAQIGYLKDLAAIPLGTLGGAAYVIGTPTDLPILLIILGVGGVLALVWDPAATDESTSR